MVICINTAIDFLLWPHLVWILIQIRMKNQNCLNRPVSSTVIQYMLTAAFLRFQIIVAKKMGKKWPILTFAEVAVQKFHSKVVQYFIEVKFLEPLLPSMRQWNWIIAIEIDVTTILLNGKVLVHQAGFQIKLNRRRNVIIYKYEFEKRKSVLRGSFLGFGLMLLFV